MIHFHADMSGAAEALGTISGISSAVETNIFINDVIKDVDDLFTKRFNEYMHAVASSNPENYHHVYEWNMTGMPGAQLWRIKLSGRGRVRTRSFEFLPSKTKVPQPEGYSGKAYRFAAKAWVMEYRIPIELHGDPLAIYLGDDGIDERTGEPANVIFANVARIERPGGAVAGRFTSQFDFWHENIAVATFESELRPKYERAIENIANAGMGNMRTGARKMKPFQLTYDAAFAKARARTLLEARKAAENE